MKSRTLMCITAAVLFAALAIPISLAAQGQPQTQPQKLPRYTVTDLGTLGGTFSVGNGINNKGWVNGNALLPGDTALHAFLWQEGVKTDLGTLGGPNSVANYQLNERGEIAGAAETSVPDPLGENFCFFGTGLTCLPFLWQSGVMTPLPTLGGNNGVAFTPNNIGQVAGQAENSTLDSTCPAPALQAEPVIWKEGAVQQLPTVPGDPDGYAVFINDKGQAVGGSGTCTASLHALLWQGGAATDLGSLGGTLYRTAQGINSLGQVVGASDLPGDTTFFAGPFSNVHAFLWQSGVITDLSTLPGDGMSFGAGINDKGQVVGFGSRAFIWQDGVMTDINSLVPGPPFSPLYLLQALDINDRSQIVGVGLAISGELHAFLAIPCDDAHPDVEGCQDASVTSAVEEAQAARVKESPAPATQVNRALGGRLRGRLDWPHTRQFPGRHVPGSGIGPTNQ